MVTISKFSYDNPRFQSLLDRRNGIPGVVPKLTNAGAVFVGAYSTEPVGDYFCGTNHILPTYGTARFSSGMSVQEFMRGYSVIRYPEEALKKNADYIIELAEAEGMRAHALAVEIRK